MLKETLEGFQPDSLQGRLDRLHEIEHSADMKKHEVLDRLAKEFIPPIERDVYKRQIVETAKEFKKSR